LRGGFVFPLAGALFFFTLRLAPFRLTKPSTTVIKFVSTLLSFSQLADHSNNCGKRVGQIVVF